MQRRDEGSPRPANLIGRKETASMLDGIMHNTRQQQAQDRARAASSKDDNKVETASVWTFSAEKPLLKGSGSGVKKLFKRS